MATITKNWVVPMLVLLAAVALEFVDPISRYQPLQRAGSLLVIWGVIIEVKYVLRVTGERVYTEAEELVVAKSPTPSGFREYLRAWMNHAGVIWIILGTALGGFADIFRLRLWRCCSPGTLMEGMTANPVLVPTGCQRTAPICDIKACGTTQR